MTHTETRTLGYAIAGSLAVHLTLAMAFALWIGLVSFQRIHFSPRVVEEQPEVTLVFPEPPPPPSVTPNDEKPFIRTSQNTEAPHAPAKADFISDRNTVASSKSAPSPNGEQPLPTMQGIDLPTTNLADRTFREGEMKRGATAVMASPRSSPPSPPTPQMKDPVAAPAKQDQLPDARKPEETREALPLMRTSEEMAAPRAIPLARPAGNKPQPETVAFQAETHRSSVKGTIGNPGTEDAVNAAVNPRGRYLALVDSVIQKKWQEYLHHRDAADPGKVGVHFYVNKHGKVEDFDFVFKEGNPRMAHLTEEAVKKSNIPPPPAELLPKLIRERMPIDFNFVILPAK